MSVGVVTALTVLLSAPAVHGMLVGATTPFEASVRLLAALVVAMVVEALLRRALSSAPATTDGAGRGPRPRRAPEVVVPQALPEELAARLRAGDDALR
ncbi:hypothetical protein [uncultured Pseudokineococcus sp.]|uniref:hypothetical protein n=1 Tax=uncultured Pseudokineococcus sp. TaxID=1642928 RepID=UPI002628F482|nr:hypothetical protein [uncultured Pseudokineococcus sp.]